MDKNEWYKVGEDIRNQVQKAIDSNDFSKLGKTIGDTVNMAMGEVASGINSAVNSVNQSVNQAVNSVNQSVNQTVNQQWNRNGIQGNNSAPGDSKTTNPSDVKTYKSYAVRHVPNKRLDTQLFYRTPKGKTSGGFCVAAGFGTMGVAGISLATNLGSLLFAGGELVPVLVAMGLTVAGFGIGTYGLGLRQRANRYLQYVGMVKDKLYCSIQDMASGTGRTEKYIRRDLKRMMRLGMFKQGHLDQKETYLIASDEMYEQYKQTMVHYDENSSKASDSDDKASSIDELPENVRTVIEEGRNYVQMIRRCNDEIPGEEMSDKLDRLEFLVTRIFAQVEKEPGQAPELRKLLSYYLPTTQKLLEAYRDLDRQEVQVQNIARTKKDIEQTVDTINQAFERFLDEMFRDTAWDIQSDISVLNTMLKQDGYLKKDF